MSKLSKLKKEAYLAGKKRDWEAAVSIYERILEIDQSNPTLINELGDICLKRGDIGHAIKNFLAAASKYRSTGLQNNAVAIFKKILRHDSENLNAHWFLAEIRAQQGLKVEGQRHALWFLAANDSISAEIKEVYLKRCIQILSLYPDQAEVLESLRGLFRHWSMPLEEARTACLQACLLFDEGQPEKGQECIGSLLESHPEVANYPEYAAWRKRVDPHPGPVIPEVDVNTLDLGVEPVESVESIEAPVTDPDPVANPDQDFLDLGPTLSPGDPLPVQLDLESPEADPPAQAEGDDDKDDWIKCLDEAKTDRDVPEESVDLLAEILAEAGPDLAAADTGQLETIATEIGKQVGSEEGEADPARMYEMGMVYLEMGLYGQACDCFEGAIADPEFGLRSLEMWGITLLRMQQAEKAIEVLQQGLALPDVEPQMQVGLLYHIGRALEVAERPDEARKYYESVHDISPKFMDVADRLADLAPV